MRLGLDSRRSTIGPPGHHPQDGGAGSDTFSSYSLLAWKVGEITLGSLYMVMFHTSIISPLALRYDNVGSEEALASHHNLCNSCPRSSLWPASVSSQSP